MEATSGLQEQLTSLQASVYRLWPEWMLIGGVVVLLVMSLVQKKRSRAPYLFALLVLIADGTLIVLYWPSNATLLMAGALRLDDFSSYFKVLMALGGLLTLLIDRNRQREPEYYLLILAAIVGANFLLMSMNFAMVLLSMELISIPSYVLATGLAPQRQRAEAAWKYFLFGSAATAIMVFGMSYLYGISGTTYFASPVFAKNLMEQPSLLLWAAGVLALSGFLFKLAAVPFHWWAPDVYQAAPTPVVAFLSVVPKLAGMGILAKFLLSLALSGHTYIDWAWLTGLIALLSILVGNLAALSQTHAKRMMAYSSIAQSGFLLIALATLSLEGMRIGLFYAGVFVLMNFLVFLGIRLLEDTRGTDDMREFAGSGSGLLVPSLSLLMGLVALVGLPPTGGFMAKLLLFVGLWEKFKETDQLFYLLLFVVGLLATVTSLFFYLKIPYYQFIKRAHGPVAAQKNDPWANLLSAVLVVLLLYLFFQPAVLMGWANKVNFVL